MRIGVVGCGVVGHATARCFMEDYDIKTYDIVKEKCTHSLLEVLNCDLIFVCLPTPQKPDSFECDTSAIDEFFGSIRCNGGKETANFVLRSTVPIGTTKSLRKHHALPNLIHSPEFLTARCAVTDAQLPSRNIIGQPFGDGGYPEGESCYSTLYRLYEKRFPHATTWCMSSDESEAVKLFQNGFFAVKVAYFNEVNKLAREKGLDWEIIHKAILADGRISSSHTNVPGPDGQYGFGGACLPKDLANLMECLKAANIVPYVTAAALSRNAIVDRPDKS